MSDTWHEIVFPEEVMPLDVTTNIVTNQILPIYIAAGNPKGFAVFGEVKLVSTEPEKDYRYVLYFTPVASEHCMSLIKSHRGVSCERPKARPLGAAWSITWLSGDPDCRNWVK